MKGTTRFISISLGPISFKATLILLLSSLERQRRRTKLNQILFTSLEDALWLLRITKRLWRTSNKLPIKTQVRQSIGQLWPSSTTTQVTTLTPLKISLRLQP